MSILARRDLLAALVALTAGTHLPGLARAGNPPGAFNDLDSAAVERIGRAWLENHPGMNAPILAARLFPAGQTSGDLAALRQRVADDFRQGAVFLHRGWRLSDTEGALFGLLAMGMK